MGLHLPALWKMFCNIWGASSSLADPILRAPRRFGECWVDVSQELCGVCNSRAALQQPSLFPGRKVRNKRFLFSRSLTHGDGACSPLNISTPQQSSPRDTTPQRIPLDCLKAKRRTPEAPPPPGAASPVGVTSQIPPHPWACGAPTIHQLHHQMSVLLSPQLLCPRGIFWGLFN